MDRELYISRCKAEFHNFEHKYMLRHVKKEVYPRVAQGWRAKAKELLQSAESNVITDTIAYTLLENARQLCKVTIVGTVIVFYDEDGFRVGFSKINPPDKYNRYIGICRAIKDAYGAVDREVPRALRAAVTKMCDFAQSPKGRSILLGEPIPMEDQHLDGMYEE